MTIIIKYNKVINKYFVMLQTSGKHVCVVETFFKNHTTVSGQTSFLVNEQREKTKFLLQVSIVFSSFVYLAGSFILYRNIYKMV